MSVKRYHCPGFVTGLRVYNQFLLFRNEHPEYFYDDCIIDTIFDSFPNMTWNGGGYNMGELMYLKDIEKLLDYYDDLNIALQLTCTNPCLEEIDMYDRYCNAVLERFISHPLNSILVASPVLENYIRNKYPDAKIDWSIVATTQPENINLDYNNYLDNYNRIVIPRIHSKDFDYLSRIDETKRDKIEILCTDPCPANCPRMASHYKDYTRTTLFLTSEMEFPCTMLDREDLFTFKHKNDRIFYEELPKYQELGYEHFKISGRKDQTTVIQNLIPYTVKPEYQYEMVFYLLAKSGGYIKK